MSDFNFINYIRLIQTSTRAVSDSQLAVQGTLTGQKLDFEKAVEEQKKLNDDLQAAYRENDRRRTENSKHRHATCVGKDVIDTGWRNLEDVDVFTPLQEYNRACTEVDNKNAEIGRTLSMSSATVAKIVESLQHATNTMISAYGDILSLHAK